MDTSPDGDHLFLLKAHGLHVTYQRLAIYSGLHNSGHSSAEELHQRVRTRFPMISLGTVYKTLEKFHQLGLVQKMQFTNIARYETRVDSHHHLICVKCLAIHDIANPAQESELPLPEGHGFKILGHEVTIRGYCHQCFGDRQSL